MLQILFDYAEWEEYYEKGVVKKRYQEVVQDICQEKKNYGVKQAILAALKGGVWLVGAMLEILPYEGACDLDLKEIDIAPGRPPCASIAIAICWELLREGRFKKRSSIR